MPKIALNQHFENPIKPKQLAMKKTIKHETGAKSKKEENIKNSVVNFSVPGRPEKKIHINITEIAKLGVNCSIPDISITDLEW